MGLTVVFVLHLLSSSCAELGYRALVLADSGSVVQSLDPQHQLQQAREQYHGVRQRRQVSTTNPA